MLCFDLTCHNNCSHRYKVCQVEASGVHSDSKSLQRNIPFLTISLRSIMGFLSFSLVLMALSLAGSSLGVSGALIYNTNQDSDERIQQGVSGSPEIRDLLSKWERPYMNRFAPLLTMPVAPPPATLQYFFNPYRSNKRNPLRKSFISALIR
jgi:hypothetical protein